MGSRGRTEARETAPILPVDDAVVDATLPHLPAVVADMVRLQRLDRLRPGEVCSLRPCDVEPRATCGSSPDSQDGAPRPRTENLHRPASAGRIAAVPAAREGDLLFHADRQREETLRGGPRAPSDTAVVGKPPRDESQAKSKAEAEGAIQQRLVRQRDSPRLQKAWPASEGVSDAEARDWHKAHRWAPNRLRHSVATKLRASYGIEAAQTVLGHADPKITLTYAERDFAFAADHARGRLSGCGAQQGKRCVAVAGGRPRRSSGDPSPAESEPDPCPSRERSH